jgi:Lar family restriction alleviation protein
MTPKQERILERGGWTVECESPFEIRDKDGNFASGLAAYYVLYYLEEHDDTNENDLKPCPFCGGVADALPQENGWYKVRCRECLAHIQVLSRFPEQAIAAWNQRIN